MTEARAELEATRPRGPTPDHRGGSHGRHEHRRARPTWGFSCQLADRYAKEALVQVPVARLIQTAV